MNIIIRPLTPALSDQYFDFFEHRAFTDDSPCRCYCQPYQMTDEEAKEAYDNLEGAEIGCMARKIAERQIQSGALKGYLAFIDDLAIGWCNSNDLVNYPVESCNGARFKLSAEKREEKRVKVVACFEIAPAYRGMGIATHLLQKILEDAKAEGYIAVEGYPIIREQRFEWDNPGPIRLYEKLGFVRAAEQGEFVVMRKELK